jgi:hypothetical protein
MLGKGRKKLQQEYPEVKPSISPWYQGQSQFLGEQEYLEQTQMTHPNGYPKIK